jgi:ring-1,2-phenylacetyl-CoA epoxidase subunit PaaE
VGNRDTASTMFADELSMLVARAEGRLRLVHVRSREDVAPDTRAAEAARWETVEAGRLDVDRVLAHAPRPEGVDGWFLCGPAALTDGLAEALTARGAATEHVHRELFSGGETGPVDGAVAATVAVTLDGSTTDVDCGADETVLDAAVRAGLDAPYSCAGGACGTCAATLTGGTVHMAVRHALTDAEVARGRVLTCQARPTSDTVAVDYDRG